MLEVLVEGPSLKDRLNAGPLSPAEAAGITAKLAGALAKLHAAGILHRDINAANVMLDENQAAPPPAPWRRTAVW